MNDELNNLLERFEKIEQEIKSGDTQEKESEILDAYNGIILYAYPIWQSTEKKPKANIKTKLVDIHKRLKNCLDILKSDIELPTYLTQEIKTKENLKTEQGNINTERMEELKALREQIEDLRFMVHAGAERQQEYEQQTANLSLNGSINGKKEWPDIETEITNADQIQLESFRCLPEFNGDKYRYRPWRNQVKRRMDMIIKFQKHPKYEAALAIIRAKITGAASDVLTNNKTSYNIYAIIEQLDAVFTDQRPLYIVEAEMIIIKQMGKSLQEYHEEINQALNLIISKITLSYSDIREQTALITEAQKRAVRTFISGLRSQSARNILYGQNPKTLSEAYTTAQTVYYDNEYLRLEQSRDMEKCKQITYMRQQQPKNTTRFYTNMNGNVPQTSFPPRAFNKQDPPRMNNENRFKQPMNWRQPNQQQNMQTNEPQKREYDSRQMLQQVNKTQRINQLQDDETNQNEMNGDDGCDNIPEDLISNATNESTVSSAFLGE